tara:strand:- start:614 stop:976 length:363 start_codon:yes stop_codon:yes gene_type:complete
MIESVILASFWVVFVLIIWFETDAFEKYVRFFHLGYFAKLSEYDKEDPDKIMDYLSFIRVKYSSSFVVSLVTCPVCLCVWLCIASSAVFSAFYYFPVVFLSSLIVYLLVKRGFFSEETRL